MARKRGNDGKYIDKGVQDYYEEVWGTGFFKPVMGCGFNYHIMLPSPEVHKYPKKEQTVNSNISRCDK